MQSNYFLDFIFFKKTTINKRIIDGYFQRVSYVRLEVSSKGITQIFKMMTL